MLDQYIAHFFEDEFLMACAIVMLLLFAVDLSGSIAKLFKVKNSRHIDFATTIVSIGLFATFFGILIGLYGFEPKNIAQSVPRLLEGLRFAFAASVLGMFLSLTLSIAAKVAGESSEGDDAVLKSIDEKMGTLVKTLESPQELVRQFTDMKEFLNVNLEQINRSLDDALKQLAKGATQEVIEALEKIIVEFNDNLQEQFGENFKELNAACLKLVDWQRNYRGQIEETERNLKSILGSFEESSTSLQEMTERNREVTEVCREVGSLMRTYDTQIRTLAVHLESCEALGAKAGEFLKQSEQAIVKSADSWNRFSKVATESIEHQSKSLVQFTQELDERLPKSLGDLESVLTNITNQFAADYRSLFQFMTDKR